MIWTSFSTDIGRDARFFSRTITPEWANSPYSWASRRTCVPICSENTLASFDLALRHGCVGFEFDVRLAGAAIAPSSVTIPRLAGLPFIARTRRQLVHLPSFRRCAAALRTPGFLNIELKVKGLETIVLDALRDHHPEREL